MKKNSVAILMILSMALFFGVAYAGGTAIEPGKMSASEMMQMVLTSAFIGLLAWLEPKLKNYFNKADEEADARIKTIKNQRIGERLQQGRVELKKAVSAAFSEFMLGLKEEQNKDGIISQNDITAISKNAVDSFLKSSTNSTGDLMNGLGSDLYESAAQEVKEIAARIWDRFHPANTAEVHNTVSPAAGGNNK